MEEGNTTHRQRSVPSGAKLPWPDTLSACAAHYSTAFRDQLALPIASELDNQASLAHSRAIVPPKLAISSARRLYRALLHRPTCLDLVLSRLDSCVVKSKRLVWHHSDHVALRCYRPLRLVAPHPTLAFIPSSRRSLHPISPSSTLTRQEPLSKPRDNRDRHPQRCDNCKQTRNCSRFSVPR